MPANFESAAFSLAVTVSRSVANWVQLVGGEVIPAAVSCVSLSAWTCSDLPSGHIHTLPSGSFRSFWMPE